MMYFLVACFVFLVQMNDCILWRVIQKAKFFRKNLIFPSKITVYQDSSLEYLTCNKYSLFYT